MKKQKNIYDLSLKKINDNVIWSIREKGHETLSDPILQELDHITFHIRVMCYFERRIFENHCLGRTSI